MSSFSFTAQHKPIIVRTHSFGTGVVSERRADGISVVQLAWGKVYLDQQSVGQVISSQYKRSRCADDDEGDDAEERERSTRHKLDTQQQMLQLQMQMQQ